MKLAYSYIRFSSPEQAKGRSKARQAEACEKYCAKHNLTLAQSKDHTFFDPGLSAYKGDHLGEKGQLTRFLRLVKEGEILPGSTLIVESLDRLSREDVWTALEVFRKIIDAEIRIVTLCDNIVYSKEGGVQTLILSIFQMSRANEESSIKAMRLRDAMKNKQAKAREIGLPMGKAIPLWLSLTDTREFHINEERAHVIQRIFCMAIDGYGRAVTAKTLNAEGIASFKGTTWGTSSINKVLNNRAVLGEYQPMSVQVDASNVRQPSGAPILGYYPSIISESVFYQAKAAIEQRKVAGSSKQSANFNVWQGIAKCQMCGTAMHLVNKGVGSKGGKYLHCFDARKGLCEAKAFRLDLSEKYFAEILAKLDSLPLVQDSAQKISKDLARVTAILSEKKEKLNQYVAIFEASPSTSVNGLINRTEQEIKGLEGERETLAIALAAEEIVDKTQFLAKLDLVTYEGRNRANTLLKRLEIVVKIGPTYFETIQGVESIFMTTYYEPLQKFGHIPLVKGQLDRFISQSDGTDFSFLVELETIKLFAKMNALDAPKLVESYAMGGGTSWKAIPKK